MVGSHVGSRLALRSVGPTETRDIVDNSRSSLDGDGSLESFDRRRFIRRAAIGGAIAVPVVTSFSMSGVNPAFAQETQVSGKPPATSTTTAVPGSTTTAPSTTSTTMAGNLTNPTWPSTTTTTLGGNGGGGGNN